MISSDRCAQGHFSRIGGDLELEPEFLLDWIGIRMITSTEQGHNLGKD